jgi:hypothetical protein
MSHWRATVRAARATARPARGHGALVRFMRHPDGRWGLQPQQWPDGHTDYWRPLTDDDKPWLLRGQDHGTQVVLLGTTNATTPRRRRRA